MSCDCDVVVRSLSFGLALRVGRGHACRRRGSVADEQASFKKWAEHLIYRICRFGIKCDLEGFHCQSRLECVTEVPTGLCPVGDVRVSSHTEHSCEASTIQMRRVPFRTRTSTTNNNSAVLILRLCCRKDVFVRWRCRCARHAHKQKPFHRSDYERLHLAMSPARNWICGSVTACLHGAPLGGLLVTPTASQWPTRST